MQTCATERFTLTLGLKPGYSPVPEQGREAAVEAVRHAWQGAMEAELARSGVRASAVVQPGWAIYSNEHGCPVGGEPIVAIWGTRNPAFSPSESAWEESVLRIAGALKARFSQVTCQVEFSDVRMVYFGKDD